MGACLFISPWGIYSKALGRDPALNPYVLRQKMVPWPWDRAWRSYKNASVALPSKHQTWQPLTNTKTQMFSCRGMSRAAAQPWLDCQRWRLDRNRGMKAGYASFTPAILTHEVHRLEEISPPQVANAAKVMDEMLTPPTSVEKMWSWDQALLKWEQMLRMSRKESCCPAALLHSQGAVYFRNTFPTTQVFISCYKLIVKHCY